MLDTQTISSLLRNPSGRIAARVAEVGEGPLCLSIITAAELRYGAAKGASPRLKARVEAVLARIPILPFDVPADLEYGEIRLKLQTEGQVIGPNDLLIAAHARSVGAIVVTANTGEFRRVDRLTVEDWTA